MRAILFRMGALLSFTSLAGCAVNIPHMGDSDVTPPQRVLNELSLLAHIQCELHVAYNHAKDVLEWEDEQSRKLDPASGLEDTSWIDDWGVKINVEYQVEVKSAFSPSLSITNTLKNAIKTFDNGPVTIGRTRGVKTGAGITRDITRTEAIAYFFPFSNFKYRVLPVRQKGQRPADVDWKTACSQKTHIVSDDNLQIYDFLHAKLELAATPGILGQAHGDPNVPEPAAKLAEDRKAQLDAVRKAKALAAGAGAEADADAAEDARPKSPFSALSYDLHFVVTRQFSVNPTWKLVEVAIGADGALYAGSRVKSDHLTMTFGPPEKGKPDKPSSELDQQHFARLIGQYVGDAVNGRGNQ